MLGLSPAFLSQTHISRAIRTGVDASCSRAAVLHSFTASLEANLFQGNLYKSFACLLHVRLPLENPNNERAVIVGISQHRL